MTRLTATALGTLLAAGLAFAAPSSTPQDLVSRYYAAGEDGAAGAQDWHPEAVHSITVKTGTGDPDWQLSYPLSDWETLPDWTEDPELQEAMQGYRETSRSAPSMTASTDGQVTVVTAKTQVGYQWGSYQGTMTQTDRFEIVTLAGKPLIHALATVYDYR